MTNLASSTNPVANQLTGITSIAPLAGASGASTLGGTNGVGNMTNVTGVSGVVGSMPATSTAVSMPAVSGNSALQHQLLQNVQGNVPNMTGVSEVTRLPGEEN